MGILENAWLNEDRKIVQEIIAESNLKQVAQKKFTEYLNSDKFAENINKIIVAEVENHIREYAEFYMLSTEKGWGEIEDKIKKLIVDYNLSLQAEDGEVK